MISSTNTSKCKYTKSGKLLQLLSPYLSKTTEVMMMTKKEQNEFQGTKIYLRWNGKANRIFGIWMRFWFVNDGCQACSQYTSTTDKSFLNRYACVFLWWGGWQLSWQLSGVGGKGVCYCCPYCRANIPWISASWWWNLEPDHLLGQIPGKIQWWCDIKTLCTLLALLWGESISDWWIPITKDQ